MEENPYCTMCLQSGYRTQATVVDHVIAHKGNQQLFWNKRNWQPLCKLHHDGAKKVDESRGYSTAIGNDGWPTDKRHPVNIGSIPTNPGDLIHDELFFPRTRPSAIPLVIVCGPPAAGKSTFVRLNAGADDIIIDLDEIIAKNFGGSRETDKIKRFRGLEIRNKQLKDLQSAKAPRGWFITTAPRPETRGMWAKMLNAEYVIVINTPKHICKDRVFRDAERKRVSGHQCRLIDKWFEIFARRQGDMYLCSDQILQLK